jgi:polar amino acid transport system substrate-binding protein
MKPYVMILLIPLLGLGIGGGSLLALYGDGNAGADTTWNHIQTYQRLVVGIDPNFPPFGIYDEAGPMGIDADLALAIGDELGVEIQFVLLSYDGIFDSLYLGQVDIVISALRPDFAQVDRFRYTRPYFDAGYVFVGLEGTRLPSGLDDLDGQTVAVEYATEGDVTAFEMLEEGDVQFELERLLSTDEALQAVIDGEADFALVDSVSAYLFQRNYPQLAIAATAEIPDPYVIAVRRPNWQLFLALEDALKSLQEHGELETIAARWLR